ncbi:class I mannose-6-phosphate isomerase [bacterium]|nr:class I mannose-6-phosphate isomerase [bacterium]
MKLYPLKFKPYLAERVWGGRGLSELCADIAETSGLIGEVWCVFGKLPVKNGCYAGLTLNELCLRYPESFFPKGCDVSGMKEAFEFPLLIKWLKAEHWLSVQVHPDDESAEKLSGGAASGKTEAWYVTNVKDGASLILDKEPDVSVGALLSAKGPHIVKHLKFVKPECGDSFLIEAGMIHALGPGITVLEVQQNSDITYRLYDWDRLGLDGRARDLHLREAEYVMNRRHEKRLESHKSGGVYQKNFIYPAPVGKILAVTDYFRMELLNFHISAEPSVCQCSSECIWQAPDSHGSEILVCTKGEFDIDFAGSTESLVYGEACVLPGGGLVRLRTCERDAEIVRVIMPF